MRKALAIVLTFAMLLSSIVALASCGDKKGGKDNKGENVFEDGNFTYNDYLSNSPETWNPHEWETNTDSYILTYTSMGLYDFVLNDEKNGYTIIPEMAADMPVDVTTEYAGKEPYGVPADAKEGYAFKIALNDKATWEDGTPINADTYLYSYKQLLSSEMKNYRASGWYSGTFTIANAYQYFMQDEIGSTTYKPIKDAGYATTSEALADGLTEADLYVDMWGFWGLGEKGCVDKDGNACPNYVSVTDETLYRDVAVDEGEEGDWISAKQIYEGYLAPGAAYESNSGDYVAVVDSVIVETPFENVGVIKTGEYEITFVLAKPITMFYLQYNLSSGILVYEKLYEENKFTEGELTKTKYATSVDTTMSYGPYKLTAYQEDKSIVLERNEKWYGYTDGKHEGQFQTDKINCQIVAEQTTALQLFLQGKLDNVALVAADMEKYRTSDYILYTPQDYTTKLTMNGDLEALKARETTGKNKSILAYKEFRKAISLSIDRNEFAAQCTATHTAGFGLLNYMYVYDPDTGARYRDSEQAKKALTDFYGVNDEDQITGYDLKAASDLMKAAYEKCKADGNISDTDVVELELHVLNTDDTYVRMVNFIDSAVKNAAKGTPLEGRINVVLVADEDYYDNNEAGQCDMIFSTWGGMSMDPWGMMEVYCVNGVHMEYGFDPEEATAELTIDGKKITKTFTQWFEALVNGEYVSAPVETRLQVLAGLEHALLEECYTTPLYYRTSASLDSQKVNNATDEYIQLVGFGGIRYLTYNYTDEEWEAYCAENNNQLVY